MKKLTVVRLSVPITGPAFDAFDKVKAGEEFCASKHGGDDGRETQCRQKSILKGSKYLSADVSPILCADVEQFEDPPDRRRDEEQADIFSPTACEQGCASAPKDQPVDAETVTQPEWKESPMRARTC